MAWVAAIRMVMRCSTVMGAPAARVFPGIGHRLQHVAARGAELDLRLREVRLYHGMVPQRALAAARHLAARHVDKAVERAAGDAAGDACKTHLVAGAGTHAIERPALAAFLIEFARDRMVCADKEVVQGELITGGAAQAYRIPDVGPFYVFGAHQHGALLLVAI